MLRLLQDYDELVRSGMGCEKALALPENRTGWYDPDLLADLHGAVVQDHEGYIYQLLNVRQLESGMIVPEGITTVVGRLLVGRGEKLTSSTLVKLWNFASWQEICEPIGVLVPRKGAGAAAGPRDGSRPPDTGAGPAPRDSRPAQEG